MICIFWVLGIGLGVMAWRSEDELAVVGNAVKVEGVVRIGMDKDNSLGGLQVVESIKLKSFEVLVDFNVSAGKLESEIAFWFSQQSQPLGSIYGLSHQFKGFGAFLELNSSTLFITTINELTHKNIKSGESCRIDTSNPISLHIYTEETTFEVWTTKKCAEIKLPHSSPTFFGIHSYSNLNSQVYISSLQIKEKPLKSELVQAHKEISQKLSQVETNLPILKQNINSLFIGAEIEKIHSDIHNLKDRIQNLLRKVPPLHTTLSQMHIEDSFTQYSNAEILSLSEKITSIHMKMEDLMDYVDSKRILNEVYESVEGRYRKLNGHGSFLKKELKQAERNFKAFEVHFEDDARIYWVHMALGLFSFVVFGMCCKSCINSIPEEEEVNKE